MARLDLRGRVCLIVGGSSGIGRELALLLGRRGAIVAVTARRRSLLASLHVELEALGPCLTRVSDATDEVESAASIAAVVAEFGRLDVLILNVGGGPAMDTREVSAREVTALMRLNYDVAVNSLMPALAQMRGQGAGRVLVVNSLAGLLGLPQQGPYSAAKGALRLLVDTCRTEHAGSGITFTTVFPGFIATERTRGDGISKTSELTETEAAGRILNALVRGRPNYRFPAATALQIRLGLLLPGPVQRAVLRRRVVPQGSA